MSGPVPVESPRGGQNFASQSGSNDAFGRRIALHGFVNARLVNNPISQVEQELGQLSKLEDKIDWELSRVRPVANAPKLPTINQDDDPAGGWNEMVNGEPPVDMDLPQF